jgi:hypothetical protein
MLELTRNLQLLPYFAQMQSLEWPSLPSFQEGSSSPKPYDWLQWRILRGGARREGNPYALVGVGHGNLGFLGESFAGSGVRS